MSELRVASIKNLAGEDLITPVSLGLEEVDNTSDLDKPLSTATAAALSALLTVPEGGFKGQSLKKTSAESGVYAWADSAVNVTQRGTTLPSGTRTLSRQGGVIEPTSLSDIIPVTSGRSAMLSIKAIARAVSGITKSFAIEAVVKNALVLNQSSVSAVSETGSGTWTLVVQWSPSLGGFQLFATGSVSENVVWESTVKVVEI